MTTTRPEPGIYYDVPFKEYLLWEYPGGSTLKKFRNDDMCELEIKHDLDNPRPPTSAMNLGTMVENAVDGHEISPEIQQLPAAIKKRSGVAWQEFSKENPGVTYLPLSEFKKHGDSIQVATDMTLSVSARDLPLKNARAVSGSGSINNGPLPQFSFVLSSICLTQ